MIISKEYDSRPHRRAPARTTIDRPDSDTRMSATLRLTAHIGASGPPSGVMKREREDSGVATSHRTIAIRKHHAMFMRRRAPGAAQGEIMCPR